MASIWDFLKKEEQEPDYSGIAGFFRGQDTPAKYSVFDEEGAGIAGPAREKEDKLIKRGFLSSGNNPMPAIYEQEYQNLMDAIEKNQYTDVAVPGLEGLSGLAREQAKQKIIAETQAKVNANEGYSGGDGPDLVQDMLTSIEKLSGTNLPSSDKRLIKLSEDIKEKKQSQLYGRGFVPEDIEADKKALTEDATEKAFKEGLNAYINAVRGTNAPAPDVKDLDEYKKIFAEATGVDVSGKVDKSAALMAFGLALMQNRAGKGFNLSRILGEVGKAGEVALPKLEAAKKEAKANAIAGGKYALDAKSADEAVARAAKEKGMIRQRYYVVPKTADGDSSPSSFLANLDNGSLQELNPYELDALYNQEGFDDKYNVFPASMYDKIVEEAIGQKEVKDYWQSSNTDVLLFNGADDDLSFKVQLPDANKAPTGTKPAFIDNADTIVGKLRQMEATVDRQEKDFKEIADSLAISGIGAGEQVMQAVVQGFRNLGFDAGKDTTPIAQIKYMLRSLQAENAADILGESGKTLSDTDRKMVAEIVGGISFTEGDEAQLARKLGRLYQKIVVTGRNNIAEGYSRLKDAGVNVERKGSVDSEIYANLSGLSSSKSENRSFIEGIETSRLQIDDDGVYNFIETG
jgi:hypothetical protein